MAPRPRLAVGLLSTLVASAASQAAPPSLEDDLAPAVHAASAPADLWPATTTVWTGDELRRRGYRTLGAALADLVGVDRIQTSLGLRYSIRGVVGGLLLVLDSVPEVLTGEQDVLDLDAGLDLGEVQRVEVVRGSVSALNGVSGLAGVVRVTTRSAGLTGAAVHAGLTDHGEAEAGGAVTYRAGDFAARASLFQRTGPDAPWQLINVPTTFIQLGRLLFPVGVTSVEAPLTDDATTLGRVTASYRDFRADFSLTRETLHDPLSSFSHGLVTNPEQSQTRGRERFKLFWSHDFERVTVQAILFGAHHEGTDEIPLYPVAGAIPQLGTVTISELSRVLGAFVRAEVLLAPDHRLMLSVFGDVTQQVAHADAVDPFDVALPGQLFDLSSVLGTATVAAEYQGDFGSGWHTTLGLAGEHHTTYGTVAAPRAAVVYFPQPWWSLRASYSEGIRAPDAYDVAALSQAVVAGEVVGAVANPSLQPERSRTAELAARAQAGGHAQLEVAAFATHLEDTLSASTNDGTWEPINLAPRWIAGGELVASVELLAGKLKLFGGASLARTFHGPADEGDVALGTLTVEGRPWPAVELGVRGHGAWRPSTSLAPGAGGVVDVYGSWQVRRPVRLVAALRNALDTTLKSPDIVASPYAAPAVIGSPARSLYVGFEVSL